MHVRQETNRDWEISEDGLYIATRGYLVRRGYCCANRCKNCPYINWRLQTDWQPIPVEAVRRTRVSLKALAGARLMLQHHEDQLHTSNGQEHEHHLARIIHYRALLERWGCGGR